MKELASYNREKVLEIADLLLDICKSAQTFEMVLKQVFEHYSLVMTFQQHVLVGSTIRSYLAWLKDQGKMGIVIEDNLLKYVTAV